ncbi:hypothetical protein Rumeso_02969 [Rubellimicrobium mesophilum DSM 19309]|uniref:Uncharacterized protein n=1 Tax=Rubellimicrobium mesophilum DSM 19309 TaxID=442562 RepID=A0A017HMB4_9RHOB|nr:hypothetical protein Rumeso_02969 [Rubellimicrobium mesophilum DSM 19309]
MPHDEDREVGRSIVGAMMREHLAAGGATVGDLQVSLEQATLAAVRAAAEEPATHGRPDRALVHGLEDRDGRRGDEAGRRLGRAGVVVHDGPRRWGRCRADLDPDGSFEKARYAPCGAMSLRPATVCDGNRRLSRSRGMSGSNGPDGAMEEEPNDETNNPDGRSPGRRDGRSGVCADRDRPQADTAPPAQAEAVTPVPGEGSEPPRPRRYATSWGRCAT